LKPLPKREKVSSFNDWVAVAKLFILEKKNIPKRIRMTVEY
jgi:hypothetical protein